MADDESTDAAQPKGGRPALIEAFGIRGLHGYRTISLASAHAATILIAKNGTGKTTLLGVLDAFIRSQFSRLRELEFESIFCKFRGVPEQLILTRRDLDDVLAIPDSGEIVSIASRLDVSPNNLFRFVTEEWHTLQLSQEDASENATYAAMARFYGYSRVKIDKIVSELYASAFEKNPNISHIVKTTRHVLDGYDIVYLPTYRRVELALRGDPKEPRYRRKRPRFDVAAGSLFTGDIRFGLADISERLAQMNERIAYESNSEYRKISADIINELIDGSFEAEMSAPANIPSREDLQLLFSRVEQSRRLGPYYPISIPNLDKLYSPDGVPEASKKFLNYFLNQLAKVIDTTRGVELRVQQFVSRCNKYLDSDESSTRIEGDDQYRGDDGKRLTLNRNNLQVSVVSVPEGRRISLDALSSGEKQMISLFAKLFLYEGPKIVLIDEPELSLSLDWQREILVDVINSPLCEQLVAITHSPFVFDNELEPYAGSLRLQSTPRDFLPFEDEERFPFEDDDFEE